MRQIRVCTTLMPSLFALSLSMIGCAGDGPPPEDEHAIAEQESAFASSDSSDHGVIHHYSNMTDEELAAIAKLKGDAYPPGRDPAYVPGLRRRMLEERSQLEAKILAMRDADVIQVRISIPEDDFDGRSLNAGDSQANGERISSRKSAVLSRLQPLMDAAARERAEVVSWHWLSEPMFVAKVSVRYLRTLLRSQGLHVAEDKLVKVIPATDGLVARVGTRAKSFIAAGLGGQASGPNGGRVRVAVIDPSYHTAWLHYGFRENYNIPTNGTRIENPTRCSAGACTTFSSNPSDPSNSWTHANSVTRILAGSLDGGEDPDVTTSDARDARSGMAPGVVVYNIGFDDWLTQSTMIKTLEKCSELQVQIANHSYGLPPPGDFGSSYTNALRASVDSGIMHFAAVGNQGHADATYHTMYPASSIHMIAVGGLTGSSPYNASPSWDGSNQGGADLTVGSSSTVYKDAATDISNMACWSQWYTWINDGSWFGDFDYDPNVVCGTSFATPATAGGIALLRHAISTSSLGIAQAANARRMMANVILLGDGYAYYQALPQDRGMDSVSGAGRLILHRPSSSDLVGPWRWTMGSVALTQQGQVVSIPVNPDSWGAAQATPAGVTQFKAAMLFEEDDRIGAADIDLALVDACNGNAIVAQDLSRNLRSRIRTTDVAGRCLVLQIKAYALPATRKAHYAFYYHSGATQGH